MNNIISNVNTAILVELIIKYENDIYNKLNKESIDVYNYITTEYRSISNVSENLFFQFVYRSFYRLDNAGLIDEFKNEYFKILNDYKNIGREFDYDDIMEISNRLAFFKTKRGFDSFQFSFISKLINTIDNNFPIWDSEVRKFFKFKNLPSKKNSSLELRVDYAYKQVKYIVQSLNDIRENKLLDDLLSRFDLKYSNNNLSFNKKMDFILWTAGKIIK